MCPFAMEVDLFNFPNRFIKERQVDPWVLRQFSEMESLLNEIVENEMMILEKESQSNQGGSDSAKEVIDLFDVFESVDRSKYPVLWDILLRVMANTPTSGS